MFYKWTDVDIYYKWFANIWCLDETDCCCVCSKYPLMIRALWSNPELGISNQHLIMARLTRCNIDSWTQSWHCTGGVSGREGNTWWSALSPTVSDQGNYPVFPEIENRKLLRCYHYHSPVATLMLLHLAQRLVTTQWHSVSDHHLRWGEGQLPISWAPLMTCHQKNAHSIGSILAKLAKWSPINFVFQRMSLFVVWNVDSDKNILIIQIARATSLVFMGIGRDFSLTLLNVFMNWNCKSGGRGKDFFVLQKRFVFCKDEKEIKR